MVKIADVASHAGVSKSTVSYVLSGKRPISPAVADRVRASIAELGYHAHASARALATSRSYVIGLVLPIRAETQHRVMMEFVMEVAARARDHDYDVLVLTEREGPDALRRAAWGLVDGLVVLDVQLEDPRLAVLRNLGRPSVLIGVPLDTSAVTCVDLDFKAAGALCVHHLAELGHQRIGFLGQPDVVYQGHYGYGEHTLQGAQTAARHRGVTLVPSPCPPLREALEKLWASAPTALVIHNESVLSEVKHWADSEGIDIPGDLSVSAICPSDVAEQSWPGITHVALPASELSDLAVDLLMARLEGRQTASTTLLAPRLDEGKTTAFAPGRHLARRGRLDGSRADGGRLDGGQLDGAASRWATPPAAAATAVAP